MRQPYDQTSAMGRERVMSLWAAAITKPLAEQAAERALECRGWRVYLPLYRKILRGHRTGKGEIVMRPLFPRYLFVELQPQLSGIVNVPGIVALVGGITGGRWKPYTLPIEAIDAIRESERAGEWDELRDGGKRCDLPLGTSVRVPELGNALAQLVGLDDDGRARVLIEILGRTVTPRVDAAGLVAA